MEDIIALDVLVCAAPNESLQQSQSCCQFFPTFQDSVTPNTLEKYGRVSNTTDKQGKQKQHRVLAAAAEQDWQ